MTTRGSMDGRPAAIRRRSRGDGDGDDGASPSPSPSPFPSPSPRSDQRSSANVSTSSPCAANISSSGSGKGGGWSEGDAARPRTTSVGACSRVPHHSPGLPSIARIHGAASGWSSSGSFSVARVDGVAGAGTAWTPSSARGSRVDVGGRSARPRARKWGTVARHSRACSPTGRVVCLSACTRRGPGRRSGERAASSGSESSRSRYTRSSNASSAACSRAVSAASRSWPNPRGVSSRSSSKTCAKALDPASVVTRSADMAPKSGSEPNERASSSDSDAIPTPPRRTR